MERKELVAGTGLLWRLCRQLLVAGLLLVMTLTWGKWPLPRLWAYQFLRDYVAFKTSWETRNWQQQDSEHFIVRYHPRDSEMAPMILSAAERYYQPLIAALGKQGPAKALVVIDPDRQALNRAFGWDASQGAMGVYWAGVIRLLSPREWLNVHDMEKLMASFDREGPVAHEYVHLLVDYRTAGNYSRWLTEGLAQYLERDLTGYELAEHYDTAELLPLAALDRYFDQPGSQSQAYRQALVTVDYLVEHYGWDRMGMLLDRLGAGDNLASAMRQVYNLSLSEIDAKLAEHRSKIGIVTSASSS